MRRAWKLPATSFTLGLTGAVWAVAGQQDVVSALLALAGGIAGAASFGDTGTASAYSYLFSAQDLLSR